MFVQTRIKWPYTYIKRFGSVPQGVVTTRLVSSKNLPIAARHWTQFPEATDNINVPSNQRGGVLSSWLHGTVVVAAVPLMISES
jgi:hypothetical protein